MPFAFSFLSQLVCSRCETLFPADTAAHLCRCGSPLLAQYDLAALQEQLSKELVRAREPSLWRYHEFLPVRSPDNVVTLGEGMTPLLALPRLGRKLGMTHLFVKDEGVLPTGSFKARGAAVGISRAKELGVTVLAMPTNGNAGAAWAAYAARAGIEAVIVMPEAAPSITRQECAINGAKLFLVNGLISDAGAIVSRAVQRYHWYDASTLKEPYRIEGKKTMGYELAEQFQWDVPDVIVYPTGGGVGIIGIYKALRELQQIGWIGERLPRLVAVQASGCDPIVRAWQEGRSESQFQQASRTIAFGINVPKALGDFLVLDAVRSTGGCAISVSDEELLQAQALFATNEGLFVCPEGAATLAATQKLRETNWLSEDERVVLLNTGTGLKYPEIMRAPVPILQPQDDLPQEW
jgi:threonine synthase